MDDLKVLSEKEINTKLEKFNGWKYSNNKISKTFEFKEFPDTVNFIQKLTPFFQNIDHHPDIHIYYRKIQFDLQRFSVGGKVTERDFIVANEIEKEYSLVR